MKTITKIELRRLAKENASAMNEWEAKGSVHCNDLYFKLTGIQLSIKLLDLGIDYYTMYREELEKLKLS